MPSFRVGVARPEGRPVAESIRPACPGVLPNLSRPLPNRVGKPEGRRGSRDNSRSERPAGTAHGVRCGSHPDDQACQEHEAGGDR